MWTPVAEPDVLVAQPRSRMPGNVAVWVLIYGELTEFAVFFTIFLAARIAYPAMFHDGPSHLNTLAGTANTVILVTSSFFVAKAVHAIRQGRRKHCLNWLWLTIAAGACYCAVKGWEYQWNGSTGVHPQNNLFFTLYYYLTLSHLVHVLIGMCSILWVALRTVLGAYGVDDNAGLESAALYWHMIDLAWIIIFPLLYVLR